MSSGIKSKIYFPTITQVDRQKAIAIYADPNSKYCVPTFYILKKETLPLIKQCLDEGNNSDLGQVIPYLLEHTVVYAYMFYWYFEKV